MKIEIVWSGAKNDNQLQVSKTTCMRFYLFLSVEVDVEGPISEFASQLEISFSCWSRLQSKSSSLIESGHSPVGNGVLKGMIMRLKVRYRYNINTFANYYC